MNSSHVVLAIEIGMFAAVVQWVLYMALEPYVRRRLEQSMISQTRLLAGDVQRDAGAGEHTGNTADPCAPAEPASALPGDYEYAVVFLPVQIFSSNGRQAQHCSMMRTAPTLLSAATSAMAVGTGTILLAEDELAVRTLTGLMSEVPGIRFWLKRAGKRLTSIGRTRAKIAMVLLDMTIPVMGGKEGIPIDPEDSSRCARYYPDRVERRYCT